MDLQTLLDNLLYYLGYRDADFCRAYLEQHYYAFPATLDGSKQYAFDLEHKINVKEMSSDAYNAGYEWGLYGEAFENDETVCPYDNALLKEIWATSYSAGLWDS